MKYQTKPVTVEAFQWDGTWGRAIEIYRAVASNAGIIISRAGYELNGPDGGARLTVMFRGLMFDVPTGWLVVERGESDFDVNSPEAFAQKYEAVQ